MTSRTQRILGLDPGLEHTGYGIIDVTGNHSRYVACGRITTKAAEPLPQRLATIAAGISALITEHKPTMAAVEEVFVNTNARSSLKLGQARGICLLVPTQHGLPVHEYAARLVKKSIVGTGGAEKHQVAHMVKVLLPTSPTPIPPDAADALAVALTCGVLGTKTY
ncbi:MAG: crossover junction endodeoxyribonuclease RuvC [Alphaproteobacteria bacterium]